MHADSHRFDGEQDPDPHESVESGPHLNEALVADPHQIDADEANIDSLLWQPQLHCPPTYCPRRAYSTACCGKHRLPAMATTIALSAYVYCLYSVLWQT